MTEGPTKEYLARLASDENPEPLPRIKIKLHFEPGTKLGVSPDIHGLYEIQVVGIRRCTGSQGGIPYVRFALDGRLHGRFEHPVSFVCSGYSLETRASDDFTVI